MLLINNSVAFMATGTSDYMGYFHERLFMATEVTPPLYWIPPPPHTDWISLCLFSLDEWWNSLCVFFLNHSVLDLFSSPIKWGQCVPEPESVKWNRCVPESESNKWNFFIPELNLGKVFWNQNRLNTRTFFIIHCIGLMCFRSRIFSTELICFGSRI